MFSVSRRENVSCALAFAHPQSNLVKSSVGVEGHQQQNKISEELLSSLRDKVGSVFESNFKYHDLFQHLLKSHADTTYGIFIFLYRECGKQGLGIGEDNGVLYYYLDYLFSLVTEHYSNKRILVSSFEHNPSGTVDVIANQYGDAIQQHSCYQYDSLSLLEEKKAEDCFHRLKDFIWERQIFQNGRLVLQIFVATPNGESFSLSNTAFVVFNDYEALLERLWQLDFLHVDVAFDPLRVLTYYPSGQVSNTFFSEIISAAFGESNRSVAMVLVREEEKNGKSLELLVRFLNQLRRIKNIPSQSTMMIDLSEKIHTRPTLHNLESRLNENNLEIDQFKQRIGLSRTRTATPSSVTWKNFLKSLKLTPLSTFSMSSNLVSPTATGKYSTREISEHSRNQYSGSDSEDAGEFRHLHLASKKTNFRKCFKCCLPTAVFNEFRSIFDVSEDQR
eukprot:jgi/Galph1/2508/GphlegSOOS_G1170.1